MIEQKPFIIEVAAEFLPLNDRTKEILAQRQAAEEAKQLRLEQVSDSSQHKRKSISQSGGVEHTSRFISCLLTVVYNRVVQEKQLKEKEDKARKQREKDQQKAMKEKERQAAQYAAQRAEEEEQSKKLGGRILMMLTKLENDCTPKEYSTSGLELGAVRTRILASQVAYNHTLTNLHLSRSNIKDEEGVELAKILYNNKTLRKLELEGNNLGPKSAKEFGKALRINKTLLFLDLESNQLSGDGDDHSGVVDLIVALESNKSLISLNLGNNKLEAPIGVAIKSMLEKNHTLIDLEIGFNQFNMLTDVRTSNQC